MAEDRTRLGTARLLGAVMLVVALLATGCSSSKSSSSKDTAPDVTTPRERAKPTNGLRLETSADQPLFLLNVAISTTPDQVKAIADNWPKDLRWMLGFQVIYDAHNPLPEAERKPSLDKILAVTDTLNVPTLVQVGTFLGWDGPTSTELADSFKAHPSLAGVSIAELSADTETAIVGITDKLLKIASDAMDIAVKNNATFLWADMGYVGPHVFLSAGADQHIADLMQKNSKNMIIQAKQNGLGRRFGTWSAALGFYEAGFAGAWGVNSEDWLWWEASLEKLGDPQVPGGLTIAGMVKSKFPNRSRLTYPDSLYGTEMLVAASSGATVYSIESPNRIVDANTQRPTPTAEQVVFPVLRLLTESKLIPTRDAVLKQTKIAYQPTTANPTELAWDQAFTGLYGPEGCTKADLVSCAQRQWLPSTGRYGIIPTLPVLTPKATAAKFPKVVTTLAGSDADKQAEFNAVYPEIAGGDSWVVRGAASGSWLLANPNEDATTTTTFDIAASGSQKVSGTLAPQSFAVLTTASKSLNLLIDNYRADSDALWTPTPTKDVPDDQASAGGTAPSAESQVVLALSGQSKEPKLTSTGGTLTSSWNADKHELTIKLSARGPVTINVSLDG